MYLWCLISRPLMHLLLNILGPKISSVSSTWRLVVLEVEKYYFKLVQKLIFYLRSVSIKCLRRQSIQTKNLFNLYEQIYAESVPYPYGNVIGEELFQSGVLPSDTDFRIFRDYGHLKGELHKPIDKHAFKNVFIL
jgi:hypothetical protein